MSSVASQPTNPLTHHPTRSMSDVRGLLTDALERSDRYLKSLDTRPVSPRPDAVSALRKLDIDLQDHPIDAREVIRELDDLVTPATMAMAGPRFFGFVIGGSLPAGR